MADKKDSRKPTHRVKRCPHCGAYLKLELLKCDSCSRKVGPPDRHGVAKKPIDWRAYLSALLAVGGFCYFIYWLSMKY